MSDYGLNFGFLRSDEHVRVSEGGFKTPASSSLLLGTMVEIDPASEGYLKQCATNPTMITGFRGLLLQEHQWDRSIYEAGALGEGGNALDSFQIGVAKANVRSIITNGAGVKVWFKNTAASDRADGRHIDAVTMATLTSVAVGDVLGWDGSKYVKVAGGVTNALMKVTAINGSYVAAVLLA